MGRPAEAAEALLKHWTSDPADSDAATYLSDLYRRLGRLREAEASARAALHATPKSSSASNALGNALAAQFRLTEAEAAFTDAEIAAILKAGAAKTAKTVIHQRDAPQGGCS